MISQLETKTVPIKLWTDYTEVEEQALKQLYTVAALPWVFKHVAVMPDCLSEDTEVLTLYG